MVRSLINSHYARLKTISGSNDDDDEDDAEDEEEKEEEDDDDDDDDDDDYKEKEQLKRNLAVSSLTHAKHISSEDTARHLQPTNPSMRKKFRLLSRM
jgi:TATA-binding protein-associated factor Taf7